MCYILSVEFKDGSYANTTVPNKQTTINLSRTLVRGANVNNVEVLDSNGKFLHRNELIQMT